MKIIHPKTRNEALSALFQVFFDVCGLDSNSDYSCEMGIFFKKVTKEVFKNDNMNIELDFKIEFLPDNFENKIFMILESCICKLFNGNSLTGISRNQIHDMISISKHVRKDSFWPVYNIKWKLDLSNIYLGYEE